MLQMRNNLFKNGIFMSIGVEVLIPKARKEVYNAPFPYIPICLTSTLEKTYEQVIENETNGKDGETRPHFGILIWFHGREILKERKEDEMSLNNDRR